jgi:hypothetical protein
MGRLRTNAEDRKLMEDFKTLDREFFDARSKWDHYYEEEEPDGQRSIPEDMYSTIFMGKDAYTVSKFSSQNVRTIIKPPGGPFE